MPGLVSNILNDISGGPHDGNADLRIGVKHEREKNSPSLPIMFSDRKRGGSYALFQEATARVFITVEPLSQNNVAEDAYFVFGFWSAPSLRSGDLFFVLVTLFVFLPRGCHGNTSAGGFAISPGIPGNINYSGGLQSCYN
jgi:hypothetical protein